MDPKPVTPVVKDQPPLRSQAVKLPVSMAHATPSTDAVPAPACSSQSPEDGVDSRLRTNTCITFKGPVKDAHAWV